MTRHAVRAFAACLLFAALPPAAGATTIGSAEGEPDLGCGNGTGCTATSGAAATAATTLTHVTLRHSGAVEGDQVAFKTLRENGFSSYTVVRSTALVALPASPAATSTTFEIPGGLPVAAGEHIGVYVGGANVRFAVQGQGGAGHSTHPGNLGEGESGQNFWASFSGTTLLLSATDGQADGGSGGGSDGGGSGDGGPGDGSQETETSQHCSSPTATPARARTSSATAPAGPALRVGPAASSAARREWRLDVIHRPGDANAYTEAEIALDRRGRRHVMGKTNNPHRLAYFGPRGRRDLGRADFSPETALALTGSGTPVVAWSRSVYETEPAPPGLVGRARICDVLFLASGPGFSATPLAVRPENDPGYQFKDVATDGRAVHVAYGAGRSGALLHQRVGGEPVRLPFDGVLRVRVAARGGVVAVAASNDRRLVVFTRRGSGRWKRTTVATRFGSWDMDLGSDGRPRVAYASGVLLRLFDGRRTRRTRIYADQVALAVDGRRNLHVAFTKVSGPSCFGYVRRDRCVGNGIFYLRTNPRVTRGRVEVAQRSAGFSPALQVAVAGRRVQIAFPGPGGDLRVRRR